MVEDSKKRGRGQRGGSTPGGKGRQQTLGTAVAAADQDAFAAFTSKYRDMLRFADADEAEAVYSMVSLTQAARQQQQQGNWPASHTAADVKGPVIEVPESRAVKRRPVPVAVPASSACSEGGRSDSSAKSAPGPPQHLHQQHWQHIMQAQHGPMLATALGAPTAAHHAGTAHHPHQQQQAQGAGGGAGVASGGAPAGDIHPGALCPMGGGMQGMGMNMSMPMGGPLFPPPGCMPGVVMGGAAGCPPGSCLPLMPWAMSPAMMQSFMWGGLPMPPLPMPHPGMMALPFMPGMMQLQGAGGPGRTGGTAAAAAEPAAGIPVVGPLPPAGNAFKAAGLADSAGPGPASKGATATTAAAAAGGRAGAAGAPAQPTPVQQAAPSTPAAAGATQLRSALQQQQQPAASPLAPAAGPAPAAAAAPDVLCELGQLDVAALRSWVVGHFCEEAYLLLLDVWRPDSPRVREAVWAWRLHVQGPLVRGAEADYRAFLVSLFGLDRLQQMCAEAANAARQGSSTLPKAASTRTGAALMPGVSAEPALPPAATAAGGAQQQQAPAAAALCAQVACEVGVGAVCGAAVAADGMMPEEQEGPSGVECEAAVTTSNLSSEPGAALTAPGPHVMTILVPASKAGGASATSPHRAQPAGLQPQGLP